jgi:hypothetical protein
MPRALAEMNRPEQFIQRQAFVAVVVLGESSGLADWVMGAGLLPKGSRKDRNYENRLTY